MPAPETRPNLSAFNKRALLSQHPLFAELRPELIDRLSSHSVVQKLKRGTTIFTKGDPGSGLFAVCVGTVKISVPSAEGKDAVFNLVREGEIFGEIALLDGRPRTADATAITDCELMAIDRRDFIPLIQSQPEIALKVIEVLCARLRHTSEQLEDIMFLHLPGRLAKTLLQLMDNAKPSRDGCKIAITQREIGQIIGMSRESTNKQLRNWERRKWIRLERGSIVVLAPKALMAITEAPY
jgi:CRP/FNR family cyclic AMP-dependent transcriptional regulator